MLCGLHHGADPPPLFHRSLSVGVSVTLNLITQVRQGWRWRDSVVYQLLFDFKASVHCCCLKSHLGPGGAEPPSHSGCVSCLATAVPKRAQLRSRGAAPFVLGIAWLSGSAQAVISPVSGCAVHFGRATWDSTGCAFAQMH